MAEHPDRLLQDGRRIPNNPFRPEPMRPERRTGRTYADPTGTDAIGNILKHSKEKKR